jgi:excisionase family DNA binding protein
MATTPETANSKNWMTKKVFTTGEAAEICKVSQQTIIRCFDSGRLQGFRVPGSRFRRIPRDELLRFMKDNEIPTETIDGVGGRKRVLVVDDDPQIVELFVDALGRDGRFEVRTASTGYDAGMLTESFDPELILLDYMLPDVNGNVVCKRLRDNPRFNGIRIVFVSGVVNPSEIDTLKASGADDFIKKPFNIDRLIARIAELLNV